MKTVEVVEVAVPGLGDHRSGACQNRREHGGRRRDRLEDGLAEGDPATFMIRPERMHLRIDGSEGLEAKVVDMVFQGPLVRFELLDVFGPLEMLGGLPNQIEIVTVSEYAGPVASTQGPRAVAEHGLWYPPDPASAPWSTIGGNVQITGNAGTGNTISNTTVAHNLQCTGNHDVTGSARC